MASNEAKSYIATVLARADAAKPGPWVQDDNGTLVRDRKHCICEASPKAPYSYGMHTCCANTAFIAHARQDTPTLAKMLLRAIGALEKSESALFGSSFVQLFRDTRDALADLDALAREALREKTDGKA